jgi:hypothetical protein
MGRCDVWRVLRLLRALRSPCGGYHADTAARREHCNVGALHWVIHSLRRRQLGPCCSPANNQERRQCGRVKILREQCPDGVGGAIFGFTQAQYHPLLSEQGLHRSR